MKLSPQKPKLHKLPDLPLGTGAGKAILACHTAAQALAGIGVPVLYELTFNRRTVVVGPGSNPHELTDRVLRSQEGARIS